METLLRLRTTIIITLLSDDRFSLCVNRNRYIIHIVIQRQ